MTTMTAAEARKQLYGLLDDIADSHEPVQIAGKRHSAVLIGEDDWRAVQETLLGILAHNPYQTPPPYEKLVGDLSGACSRRINIQHRLVYQVLDDIARNRRNGSMSICPGITIIRGTQIPVRSR